MIRLCVELSLGFPLSDNSSIQNSNETEEEKNKKYKIQNKMLIDHTSTHTRTQRLNRSGCCVRAAVLEMWLLYLESHKAIHQCMHV